MTKTDVNKGEAHRAGWACGCTEPCANCKCKNNRKSLKNQEKVNSHQRLFRSARALQGGGRHG